MAPHMFRDNSAQGTSVNDYEGLKFPALMEKQHEMPAYME